MLVIDVFDIVFKIINGLGSFFTGLYDFLFTNISFSDTLNLGQYGWYNELQKILGINSIEISVFGLLTGVGLITFLIWGLLK